MHGAPDAPVRRGQQQRRSSTARRDHHRAANSTRTRPAPLLGSIRGNSTPLAAMPFCPLKPGQTVRSHSGQDVPADCGRVSCPVCIFPITRKASKALAMAQPAQLLTVTGLPRTRAGALGSMRRIRSWFARRNIQGVWAYHLEVNPLATGAHAHVWWRGNLVSRSLLAEAARASGAGHDADARRAFAPPGSISPELAYGLKSILTTRPANPTDLSPEARAYLDLNGGQLVTASHGYWIDWDGEPVPGGAVPARTVANGWSRPLPQSSFLTRWRQTPIASRLR